MFRLLTIMAVLFVSLFYHFDVDPSERLEIVVSIYPLKDIVEQIGGERVRVDFIVPPGASPHTFEPKPSDMKRLSKAKSIFLIGGGLEFWSEKVIRSLKEKPKIVILSKGLPLMREDHKEGHHHDHAELFDPHVWLDPLMVMTMVDRIKETLIDLDPPNKSYYTERAQEFKMRLGELHSRIEKSIRGFRFKEFVTIHPAWNYFAKRYGLRVMGIIEESPGKEASPAHIARIVEGVRKAKGKIVFMEPQFNPKAAEVIAKETGARLFILDPIGGPNIKGRDSYIGLMNYNLSIFERALR